MEDFVWLLFAALILIYFCRGAFAAQASGPGIAPPMYGPGGTQRHMLGPGGERRMLGPGGTQRHMYGPGGERRMLGPGGERRMLGPGGAQGKSNFMAYTIQGGDPFSDGIFTAGGTFTNTSNLM